MLSKRLGTELKIKSGKLFTLDKANIGKNLIRNSIERIIFRLVFEKKKRKKELQSKPIETIKGNVETMLFQPLFS